MFGLQPPRHISTLPFATGPSPHPVELCLLCPQKRKSNQGLGICHDGLWRVDDAATSFNAQAFSNRSASRRMPFPGPAVGAGELRRAGWHGPRPSAWTARPVALRWRWVRNLGRRLSRCPPGGRLTHGRGSALVAWSTSILVFCAHVGPSPSPRLRLPLWPLGRRRLQRL